MLRPVTHNFVWKLFSLLVAIAMWAAFVGDTEVAASIPASIHFKNLPRDLEMSSDIIERLYINVNGPKTRLDAATLAQTAVVFDLASINAPGEHTLNLDSSSIELPAGVTLSRVVPSQLRVRFEKRVARDVPVEVRFAGPPPEGYRVASATPSPDNVRIMGPASKVDAIRSASTDAIDLSSTVGDAEFRAPAFVNDPQVRVEGSPVINVRIRLEKILSRQN
jgi:YbbR domain-containing protein